METSVRYPHLKLREWPFYIGWNECLYPVMADRKTLQADIRSLIQGLSRRPTSTIHLMWAWFGSGKTHTLRHMEYLCRNEYNNITPVYMEFTRATRNFLDIYRAFISQIDIEVIDNAFLEICTNQRKSDIYKSLRFDFPDLANALRFLYTGDDKEQDIVVRWLRTECRELRLLRTVGITRPIQTAEDALKLISWLIRLISLGGSADERILWIIDEFQYIKGCRTPAQEEITSCLRAIFNKCTRSLSLIISFSGRPESKKMPEWLPKEITDIIGIEPVLLLPPMTSEDSLLFVKDLLAYFRDYQTPVSNEFYPFTEETVKEIVNTIVKIAELKPRSLMQFLDIVLKEADAPMQRGEFELISPDFANRILRNKVILDDEE